MQPSKKIVLLGHQNVGKTAFVLRFVQDKFCTNCSSSSGVHIYKRMVRFKNENILLFIWDLEGNIGLDTSPDSYLIGAEGFILLFDISNPFDPEYLADQVAIHRKYYPTVPLLIVGNKKDMITTKKLDEILQGSDFDFTSASAKTGENVNETFIKLAATYVY